MPKVTSTVNQMRQEAKYAFTMRVTDTTSTQGEHDSISNEVAALTHAKLSAFSDNDIPIDTIRAIYTRGAGKFTLTVPESFSPVARNILATIGLEQAGTGFKYRLRFEEIQDTVHKGQDVRDTNTWCHIKVGKAETASYATIRDAAKEACNTAGVTFIEDKFHELKRKEGVGQATGFYHCQFELKGWKFDWAATKKVARLGSSDSVADILLSKRFIEATDLCTFCWARPLPEFERPSVQERWPCTCVRTHGTGESSTGKRKQDVQAALSRIQKKMKDIGDAPF